MNRSILSLLLFPIAGLFLFSCNKDDDGTVPPETIDSSYVLGVLATPAPFDLDDIEATFAADIPYDEDTATVFDIFLPVSETATPVVVFIHGGGFISGDKSQAYDDSWRDIKNSLRLKYAYVTVNYPGKRPDWCIQTSV